MDLFSFGKRRRKIKRTVKTPPKALLRRCKKYRIKTTVKRGIRRVYKTVKVLKKLLSKKLKKIKKMRKRAKKMRKRVKKNKTHKVRYAGFGELNAFSKPSNYGYNQEVVQTEGVLPQTI